MPGPKRVLRIALISVGSFVGLIVMLIVLLAVFFPSDQVREIIHEQAGTYIARPVHVGDIGLALWPNIGVNVSDIVVENDPALSDAPLFSVDKIVLAVRVLPLLLDRQLFVKRITIDRPVINMVVDESGTSSIDNLLIEQPAEAEVVITDTVVAEEAGPAFGLVVEEFAIKDASLSYEDRQQDMRAKIGAFNQTLSLDIAPSGDLIDASGTFAIDGVETEQAGQGFGPTSFSGAYEALVDVASDSVSYGLDFNLAGIPLGLSGRVHTMSTIPDVIADIQIGRIEIASLIDQLTLPDDSQLAQMEATGALSFAAKVHAVIDTIGEQRPIEVDGQLVLDGIGLNHPDLPKSLDDLSGEILITTNTVDIRNLVLQAGATNVSVAATLNGWQGDDPHLEQSNINATVVLDELGDIVELPEGTSVGGTVKVAVTASGPVSDPLAMRLRGGVDLIDIAANSPDLPLPISKLAGSITLTLEEITIPDIGVWIGSSEIHLADVSVKDFLALASPDEYPGKTARVGFEVRGPLLDLDEMFPVDEDVPVDTSVLADTTILIPGLELPPVVVNGKIRIDRIVSTGAEFTDVGVDLGVRNNRVTVDGGLTAFEGSVKFDGRLDVSTPEVPRFAFSWDVSSVQANAMASTLSGFDDRIYGTAFVDGSISGSGSTYGDIKRTLVMDTRFRAGNGYLNNWEVVQKTGPKIAGGIDKVKAGWGTAAVSRMGLSSDRFEFGQLDGAASLRNETLTLTDIGLIASDQEWRTNGVIRSAFDEVGELDIRTELTFSEDITLQLADASAGVMSLAVPVSGNDIMPYLKPPNHLQVVMPIKGTTVEPDIGFPNLLTPLRRAAENAVRAKLGQARSQATAEARRRAEQAEAEAQRVADQAKREAEEKAREAAKKAASEATKRVRGLLGR
jgi:hypothetical protein